MGLINKSPQWITGAIRKAQRRGACRPDVGERWYGDNNCLLAIFFIAAHTCIYWIQGYTNRNYRF